MTSLANSRTVSADNNRLPIGNVAAIDHFIDGKFEVAARRMNWSPRYPRRLRLVITTVNSSESSESQPTKAIKPKSPKASRDRERRDERRFGSFRLPSSQRTPVGPSASVARTMPEIGLYGRNLLAIAFGSAQKGPRP